MNQISLRALGASVALLSAAALPVTAQTPSSEVEQLRASVKSLQEMVLQQNAQISRLEQQQGGNTRGVPAPAAPSAPAAPTSIATGETGDGYILVPNTGIKLCLNLSPRLDVIADTNNVGIDNRFAGALLPVKNNPHAGTGDLAPYDNAGRSNISARGSNVTFVAVTVDSENQFEVFYNNDFYNASGSDDLGIRINHLYARYSGGFGKLTFGKTYSPFENPDAWPATLDYNGASSKVFYRPTELRYDTPVSRRGYSAAFALSNPSPWLYSDNLSGSTSTVNHLPDFTANVRWENEKWGCAQLGAIVRELSTRNSADSSLKQDVFAWGLSLSVCPNITASDSVQLEATYGQGIFGSTINDAFRAGDIAFNNKNDLKALAYWGFLAGYTHKWSPKYRSTASYSVSNLKNVEGQREDAYHRVQYASLNFVWTIRPRFEAGIECLYGHNKVCGGFTGDDIRTQMTLSYSLF